MSMIKIENLTFSYPTSYDNVFENVSFQVDTDWKLGFVGRNGRGKTTFLNLLLGKYEYSGKILSSVQFDYFPYPVSDKNRITEDILQEVCPLAEEWELMRELSYLDVDVDVLWRPFETLSNGEQTKVLIAALFLNEGHFLLIDEPTNHLDAKARKSVAAYLKKKKGFILVSHDRRFLDDCVDHILSINRANIEVQSGNFSSWMSNFERQQEFELAQNERLQKDIRRLQQSAKRAAVCRMVKEVLRFDCAVYNGRLAIVHSGRGALMANLNSENPHVGRKFQEFVQTILKEKYNTYFEQEAAIPIGRPPKEHKFDLANADRSIVAECKCYTWTDSGNVPSAKLMGLDEAVFYFGFLPSGTKKLLCMKKAVFRGKQETLAEYYVRAHGHLLEDVSVIEISDDGTIKIVRDGSSIPAEAY